MERKVGRCCRDDWTREGSCGGRDFRYRFGPRSSLVICMEVYLQFLKVTKRSIQVMDGF